MNAENSGKATGTDNALVFDQHFMGGDSYHSPYTDADAFVGTFTRRFPNLAFYLRLAWPVFHLCGMGILRLCDDAVWALDSARVARALENSGCPLHVEGMEHISASSSPCVFVGNHMSTLETFVLPSIIRPRRPVTFVVKDSLMRVPGFGQALAQRNPIVVGRKNPRDDLHTVLSEGEERLRRGISIIVFPQSTRSAEFVPARFNTIGVKLAKRANVPIVPLALLTDAWAQGRRFRDFGPLHYGRHVYFRFYPPVYIRDQGKEEHRRVCEIISEDLARWRAMP